MRRQGRRSMFANKAALHWTAIVLGIVGVVAPNYDCPEPCSCKWISGKKTALCQSAELTRIPDLNEDIQVVDLKYNRIPYLYKDAFKSVGLVNIQKVLMSNVTLKEIHRDAFNELLLLIEVDLSDNLLKFIPKKAFSQNERLRTLILSGNPLSVLKPEQFSRLPHLRTLELENCRLRSIDRTAFAHLGNLENLNLKSNRLGSLTIEVFSPLVKLKSLSLDGNPWRCDCHLKEFRNWYLKSNLHSVSLLCAEPEELKHHYWENIVELDFSCYPMVTVIEPEMMNCDPGDNVSLHCYVSGDPEPRAVWMFNGEEITNSNDTELPNRYEIQVDMVDDMNKWLNLTIVDVGPEDAGEYACYAKNYLGSVSSNLTVILAEVSYSVLHTPRSNHWFLFTGLVIGCLIIVIVITSTVACGCMTYNRKKRRRHRMLAKANESKCYYDQEKQLLEISSPTEQHSHKSSYEHLDSSVELLKHPSTISMDRYNTCRRKEPITPLGAATSSSGVLGVYPPPPEFSNSPPSNIFISVSLDPSNPSVTVDRFPDLLDSHRRAAGKDPQASRVPFATMPRRPLAETKGAKYDNMGRRVTAAGSSTMSLNRIPTPPPPPLAPKPEFHYM